MLIPLILALGLLHDAAALQRTDRVDLTLGAAVENLAAARAAAPEYDVDADLLLSIAWHESRYTPRAVTAEPGGLWSCGVMTPEPMRTCRPGDLAAGYRAGARHLRGWLDAERGNLRRALLGYAGGFRLIAECARGPVLIERAGRDLDLCGTPDVFLDRAAWIRRERSRLPRHPSRASMPS